jgi:hypothetical protein
MNGAALADINHDGTLDIIACSGLIVESSFGGLQEPVLANNLIMWCNTPARQAVVAPEDK